jgi:hypothetical protein
VAARDERLALNQANFRYANERLQDIVQDANVDHHVIAFLCECADETCYGRVEITLEEYDDAHMLPNSYVILTGHPRIEAEEIVEEHDLFDVVQKES